MGVTRTVTIEGSGRTPRHGEVVKAHYTGRLAATGEVFDSSHTRGKPLTFMIGIGSVIKGWDDGILQMKLGEHATLEVSSDYAYGEEGTPGGPIPPNADLIFDVELLAAGDDYAPGVSNTTCEAITAQCIVQ